MYKPFDIQFSRPLRELVVRLTLHFVRQRKQLDHSNLITEVIHQLTARFLPDVTMVKKRIESLIEREYLERVEDPAKPAYRYMA